MTGAMQALELELSQLTKQIRDQAQADWHLVT